MSSTSSNQSKFCQVLPSSAFALISFKLTLLYFRSRPLFFFLCIFLFSSIVRFVHIIVSPLLTIVNSLFFLLFLCLYRIPLQLFRHFLLLFPPHHHWFHLFALYSIFHHHHHLSLLLYLTIHPHFFLIPFTFESSPAPPPPPLP